MRLFQRYLYGSDFFVNLMRQCVLEAKTELNYFNLNEYSEIYCDINDKLESIFNRQVNFLVDRGI